MSGALDGFVSGFFGGAGAVESVRGQRLQNQALSMSNDERAQQHEGARLQDIAMGDGSARPTGQAYSPINATVSIDDYGLPAAPAIGGGPVADVNRLRIQPVSSPAPAALASATDATVSATAPGIPAGDPAGYYRPAGMPAARPAAQPGQPGPISSGDPAVYQASAGTLETLRRDPSVPTSPPIGPDNRLWKDPVTGQWMMGRNRGAPAGSLDTAPQADATPQAQPDPDAIPTSPPASATNRLYKDPATGKWMLGRQSPPAGATVTPPAEPSLGERLIKALDWRPFGSAQAAERPRGDTGGLPMAQEDTPQVAAPAAAPPARTPPPSSIPAGDPAVDQAVQGRAPPTPPAGGGSVDAALDRARAGVAARPAQPAQPPPPATVTLPAPPTGQEQPVARYTRPPFDPRPYAALAEQAPQYRNLVDRIAAEEHVDPARLAWHWKQEGGLNVTAPRGAAGEIGPLQIMPATAKMIDPSGKLDPAQLPDALRIAARYIHENDSKFGENTPLSFAAYQGGAGSAQAIANGEGHLHPRTVAYMAAAFPGQQIGREQLNPSIDANPRQLVQAGIQGGPDAFIRYLTQTGPGMPMSDKWRAAEQALVKAAVMKGDYAGAQHARDFVLQMSQQGNTTSLIGAYRALQAGDTTTATQLLARANAFFPDGMMGRFGTDRSGNVWGQRVDEHDPSRAIGEPFQVTPQVLQGMLVQSRDPNAYLQAFQQQQKTAQEIRFSQQHGNYFADQLNVRRDLVDDRNQQRNWQTQENNRSREFTADQNRQSREEAARIAGQARVDAAGIRTAGAGTAGPSPQAARQIDTETSKLYTPDTMAGSSPEQIGMAAMIHTDLRLNSPAGTMPPAQANAISTGILNGSMVVRPGANGTYGVFPKAAPGGAPVAVLSGGIGARLHDLLMPGGRQVGVPMSGQPPATVVPRTSSAIPMQGGDQRMTDATREAMAQGEAAAMDRMRRQQFFNGWRRTP